MHSHKTTMSQLASQRTVADNGLTATNPFCSTVGAFFGIGGAACRRKQSDRLVDGEGH